MRLGHGHFPRVLRYTCSARDSQTRVPSALPLPRFLLENINWLRDELGDYEDDYIIIDCPGLSAQWTLCCERAAAVVHRMGAHLAEHFAGYGEGRWWCEAFARQSQWGHHAFCVPIHGSGPRNRVP